MKSETVALIQSLATKRAASLCSVALTTLALGRKTFVEGRFAFVPWSAEKREEMKALQLNAFKPGYHIEAVIVADIDPITEGAPTEEQARAILAEAMTLYCETGRAEVARLFATPSGKDT